MKTKNVLKKFLGGALALVMALGIFAGTGIDARAEEGLQFTAIVLDGYSDENLYSLVEKQDWLDVEGLLLYQEWIETNITYEEEAYYIINVKKEGSNYCYQYVVSRNGMYYYVDNDKNLRGNIGGQDLVYVLYDGNISPTSSDSIELRFKKVNDPSNNISVNDLSGMIKGNAPRELTSVYQMMRQIMNSDSYDNDAIFIYFYQDGKFASITKSYNVDQTYSIQSGSYDLDGVKWYLSLGCSLYVWEESVSGSSSASNGTSSETSYSTPHTHSYSWVTVQEANAGQDGIEEYRCSCGDVQERSVIPASAAIVDGFCNAVKNAPVDGIAEYDSGWWHTMSDYLIRELAKRPDVTTVITFEYERQMYKMTIPAGVDYTALLADEDYFYGYFYFANAVGATIETIKTTQ